MRYERCKCGKIESWSSGMPNHDCVGCNECNTTLAMSPDLHKDLKPHDFNTIQYDTNTGKPYKMCTKCNCVDEKSREESKKKD